MTACGLPYRFKTANDNEENTIVKRFIAICLLIVCIALPIASMAGFECYFCHKTHAYLYTAYELVGSDANYHYKQIHAYMLCDDCGKGSDLGRYGDITAEAHNLKHYTQWVTATITYEYDKCLTCGSTFNTTTIYH